MSTNGTPATEQTLNEQPDTEAFISKLTDAISAGDEDKITALMNSEAIPKEVPEIPNPETVVAEVANVDENAVTPNEEVVVPPVIQPPDELTSLKSELHAIKSRVGRFDSVQSQVAELKKLIKEQAALIAAQPKPPSKVDERLTSLKDIDPDMAETLSALREELSSIATPQAPPVPDEAGFDVEGELARVRRVHPDLDDVLVGGKARAEWEQWKSLIPPQARALAESPYAEEYTLAVSAFKADLPTLRSMNSGVPQTPVQQAPVVAAPDNAALQAERDRKLQATPTPKNAPIKNEITQTFNAEETVAQMMKEIQKRDNLV